MREIKVSIIVPVYNVERYLAECLESVLNQKLKDMEVIVVNDGSTDKSGEICRQYAAKDPRIKLIEKENGGLSSARNAGLDVASGEYIGFVDSDDIVMDCMYQVMLEQAITADADVVCSDYFEFYELQGINSKFITCKTAVTMSGQEAISKMLYPQYFRCFAWNKFYKQDLLHGIRFPEGKLFEDIYTVYKIFSKSKTVVYCRAPLYGYRVREESISRQQYNNRSYELIEAIDAVLSSIDPGSMLYQDVLNGYIFYYMTFINLMICSGVNEGEAGKRIRKIILSNQKSVLKCREMSSIRKIQMEMYALTPSIYRLAMKTKKRFESVNANASTLYPARRDNDIDEA